MKAIRLVPVFIIISACAYAQKGDSLKQSKSEEEPAVSINVQKEYDDEGNIIRYDSAYTWSWPDKGIFDEEQWKEFEKKMDRFWEDMNVQDENFIFGFKFEDHMKENFRELKERLEQQYPDSTFIRGPWEDLIHGQHFNLHGFNFDNETMEKRPFNKEEIEEFQKRMKDLFDNDLDQRIRKFIEAHKKEIDEIRYQIRKSIPKERKMI